VNGALAPVRVAICEDSRLYAHGLRRFLELDGDAEVVGVHATAESLLNALADDRPDLVTMDLELPGMDGIRATEQLVRRTPAPIVVVSAHTGRGSDRAAAALTAGALDAIPKAELALTEPDGARARALRRRLLRLARTQVRSTAPPPPVRRDALPGGHGAAAVGIVSSTGGPRALELVLRRLPARPAVPVLVVQHISDGFTDGLARWLDAAVPPPVAVAAEGRIATPGVWFAPDGAHLQLDESLRMAFDRATAIGPHRPSGDVLLTSLAHSQGADAVAIVLTGMGRDGSRGLAAVRAAGGLTITQDEASAVVDGMPAAARRAGAEHVLATEEIATLLAGLRAVSRR
jgi:two-component system chemotaxis response regulator CheB